MNPQPTPPSPSPASNPSHLSIIILASLVVLIGIIVVTTRTTAPPQEEQQSLSTSPHAQTRVPDTLDEEIDQQIRTLGSGSTLIDIDKDIESTHINAADQEIEFLDQEMQPL
ncbi:MAG: hypothetical protein Q8R30_04295 [bacterium]|nr:hypothetical protein [bacterium]